MPFFIYGTKTAKENEVAGTCVCEEKDVPLQKIIHRMSHIEKAILRRSELLMGADTMVRIASKKVIIFGVGGVGSWCAESLIRSGIMHLTIVDSDRVWITNVNRQLMATMKTVGRVKTDVLRERLLEINPNAEITAIQGI